MFRRKLVSARKFMEKKRLGRRLTRQKQGLMHARLRGEGRVCSSPVSAPPELQTVWVSRSDPRAPIMLKAASRAVVPFSVLAGIQSSRSSGLSAVSGLGIAAIPACNGDVQLVGTSPKLARIANQFYHGRRRRLLGRRELIESVLGLRPNGRRTSVTEQRLEYALSFFCREFGSDLSDLIDHEFVLI